MAVLQFNDKAARALERVYSSVDVVAQREATLERLALRSGESVIVRSWLFSSTQFTDVRS